MLVKELIAELNKMPQDAEIVTPSEEWINLYIGFDIVKEKIIDNERVVVIK